MLFLSLGGPPLSRGEMPVCTIESPILARQPLPVLVWLVTFLGNFVFAHKLHAFS